MHRFFIAAEHILSSEVNFPEETGRQIGRVLRLKIGEQVAVLDNLGYEYQVALTAVSGRQVSGDILAKREIDPEPQPRLFLYLCLSQREKFEWMLQKCTEIGAAGFIPVISSRSLVQDSQDKSGGRTERWKRIIKEAAEQSGRGLLPLLLPARKFMDAVGDASAKNSLSLIPSPGPDLPGLHEVITGVESGGGREIGVFIGPEGGFSDEEMMSARAAGVIPVGLGRRVLRMETAAMVVTALILHEFGEMG